MAGVTIEGRTRLAGVVGWPVGHSLSPRLHNHWLARYGIDGAYVPLPVAPDAFETAILGLRAAGFAGCNVTLPHKERAFAIADRRCVAAEASGAANTLVFRADGAIDAMNTDGAGFLANLASGGPVSMSRALVLGAGGTAASVGSALIAAGIAVDIANRTASRADALAMRIGGGVVPWEAWPARLGAYDLMVNTTSLGLGAPWAPDLSGATPALIVADCVYGATPTSLILAARARGLRAVEGQGMLAHQAVPGFAAWFGRTPEVDGEVMALLAASGA